jgi:hypothetical protein
MTGMASDTTEPSMKPMLEARIAETSTYRRASGGQKTWLLLAGVGVVSEVSMKVRLCGHVLDRKRPGG